MVDTGSLYRSVAEVSLTKDDKVVAVTFRQEFNEYGHYVERASGRNTPRGNPGDIGRGNPRKKKPWFSRKYFASMFNVREFMADNLGMETCLAITDALERVPKTFGANEF